MQTNYSCFCYLPLNHFNMITADEVYTHSAVSATEGRARHFLLPGLRGYSDAHRHAPFPDVLRNLMHILIKSVYGSKSNYIKGLQCVLTENFHCCS